MEGIAQWMTETLRDKVPAELIVFIVSLFPILECRGGLIAAGALNINWVTAYILCFLGNMLPIPFILLFIRRIFQWLKKFKFWKKVIEKLEIRAARKSETVKKYRQLGLMILVAIPLPGTGAWTGALVASLMDMRIKNSLPIIAIGVAIAGFIMTALSYGLFAIIR